MTQQASINARRDSINAWCDILHIVSRINNITSNNKVITGLVLTDLKKKLSIQSHMIYCLKNWNNMAFMDKSTTSFERT